MTGVLLKKKLMLEDYIAFFQNPDLPKLTTDQIHEIVTMHGFIRPKLKRVTIEGLKSIEMKDPTRSTVGERSVYPCAPLEVEEVRADIRSLGWDGCPVGSILAVGSSADGEEKEEKKRKKRDEIVVPPSISASSAMTTVVEKKKRRRRKKAAAAAASPPPISASPPMKKKKKKKKKKKGRKMISISKALVVV